MEEMEINVVKPHVGQSVDMIFPSPPGAERSVDTVAGTVMSVNEHEKTVEVDIPGENIGIFLIGECPKALPQFAGIGGGDCVALLTIGLYGDDNHIASDQGYSVEALR